ncbi:MAG TPA: hypothetical protein VII06_43100 [Chloroflexota bacterium]|jgi:hypothetical protein
MTATIHSNDTTVTLPATSATELAALVQSFIAAEAEAAERIQRGVAVLLSGALHTTDTCGVYRVDGCEGRVYRTSSGSCDCPDSVNRQRPCKHQYSARLLSAASAMASWNRRMGEAPPPPPPVPEVRPLAPCRECAALDDLDAFGCCAPCAYEATRSIGYALTDAAEALLASVA